MPLQIDIAVECDGWQAPELLQSLADKALHAAAACCDVELHEEAEVSLVFHDDDGVQILNREWRDQDKPTNVLSFAANEGDGPYVPMLGDIILARETIAREAVAQDKSFDDHLTHLLVHGFLHLIGFDHQNDREAEEMEALEIDILASLKIADPYLDDALNVSNIAE